MNNDKTVKIVKGVGMLLSIGGMILTSWVSSKENEKTLQKLFDKHVQK